MSKRCCTLCMVYVDNPIEHIKGKQHQDNLKLVRKVAMKDKSYRELSKVELKNLAIERKIPMAHVRTMGNLIELLEIQDTVNEHLPRYPSSLKHWQEVKVPSREEVMNMTGKPKKDMARKKLEKVQRTSDTDRIFAEVAKKYPALSVSGSKKETRYTLARLKNAGGATFYMSQAACGTFKLNELRNADHKFLSTSAAKVKATLTQWVEEAIKAHTVVKE